MRIGIGSDNEAGSAIEILDVFHSIDLMEDLYIVLNHIFIPPSTFYIDNNLVINQTAWKELEKYFPKALANFIEQHLLTLGEVLNIPPSANGGWEFWSRVSTNDSPSFGYLHVDNDEYLRSKSNSIVTPSVGTILYVGPTFSTSGGETAFLKKSKEKNQGLRIFATHSRNQFSTDNFVFVSPNPGRVVAFDGVTPHAIMWAKLNKLKPRVTFLANYWEHRISSVPNGICAITPSEYKGEHEPNKN